MKMKLVSFIVALIGGLSVYAIAQTDPVAVLHVPTFITNAELGDAYLGEVVAAGGAQLKQVKVLNQFYTPGSTVASCGYHAVRNATLMARASIDSRNKAHYLEQLQSGDHMQKSLEGYRSHVICQRLKPIADKTLRQKMLESIKGDKRFVLKQRPTQGHIFDLDDRKYVVFDALPATWQKEELDRIIKCIKGVQVPLEVSPHGLHCRVNPDEAFQKYKSAVETNVEAYMNMKDDDGKKDDDAMIMAQNFSMIGTRQKFDKYCGPVNCDIKVSFEGKLFIHNQAQQHNFETERLDGEWVNDGEIGMLLNSEIESDVLQGISFARYGLEAETSRDKLVMSPNAALEWTKDFEEMQRGEIGEIRELIQKNRDFTAIVIVFPSDHGILVDEWSTTNNKHWISVVVNSVGGRRQYLVMDSASDYANRLEDKTVTRLIEFLEGVQTSSQTENNQALSARTNTDGTQGVSLKVDINALHNPRLNAQSNISSAGMSWKATFGWAALLGVGVYGAYAGYKYYYGSDTSKDTKKDTKSQTDARTDLIT